MVRALLFDLNGVVVDDMRYHERAWIALAQGRGRELTVEQVRTRLSGKRNAEILEELFGASLAPGEAAALEQAKEEAYRRAFAPELRPVPGLLALLDQADATGVPAALVTSAPPENIDFVLDGLDLRRRFRTLVTAADVTRGKPDPAGYLLAAERLETPPAACVVFEDALLGIEAGRRAGMPVVGVATTHTPAELTGRCDRVIADFTGVRLDELGALTAGQVPRT